MTYSKRVGNVLQSNTLIQLRSDLEQWSIGDHINTFPKRFQVVFLPTRWPTRSDVDKTCYERFCFVITFIRRVVNVVLTNTSKLRLRHQEQWLTRDRIKTFYKCIGDVLICSDMSRISIEVVSVPRRSPDVLWTLDYCYDVSKTCKQRFANQHS